MHNSSLINRSGQEDPQSPDLRSAGLAALLGFCDLVVPAGGLKILIDWDGRRNGKRGYTTLPIPARVAERMHKERCK